MAEVKGSCLCGEIRLTMRNLAEVSSSCHCGQCRKWGSGPFICAEVEEDDLAISDPKDYVGIYEASEYARRAFCKNCGSSLYWHGHKLQGHEKTYSISLGLIEGPTDVKEGRHIFCQSKGDYYDIAENVEQVALY
ncbi:GFA family protein [Polycladidibacter stylochi]|uniref:GFA family protein n=1 Tax=Polycladidibacter stylochi TaxID=1807766 RepID=UPI00082E761D|nr:GFA family protein [Pseudovibrio stylochi]